MNLCVCPTGRRSATQANSEGVTLLKTLLSVAKPRLRPLSPQRRGAGAPAPLRRRIARVTCYNPPAPPASSMLRCGRPSPSFRQRKSGVGSAASPPPHCLGSLALPPHGTQWHDSIGSPAHTTHKRRSRVSQICAKAQSANVSFLHHKPSTLCSRRTQARPRAMGGCTTAQNFGSRHQQARRSCTGTVIPGCMSMVE